MKIPLTIKHSKEDIPFFTMAKASLLGLIKREYKISFDEEWRIVDDWIENKKCKCSKNINIQNKKISLDCKHLNRKIDSNKKIKEAREKIERMSSALVYRNLYGGLNKLSQSGDTAQNNIEQHKTANLQGNSNAQSGGIK